MPKWTESDVNSKAYGTVSFGTDTDQSVAVDPWQLDSNGVVRLAAPGASSYDTTMQRTGPGTVAIGGVPVGTGATVAAAGATVTGVTTETVLASGYTVPANSLAAGQAYRFVAWGTLTTTATTQTVDVKLRYGGLTGTVLLDFGAQNPSSGSTITGARWRVEVDLIATSATAISASGEEALNFFPTTENGQETSALAATAAQLVLTATPNATGLSMTCTGFRCGREA